MSGKVGGSRKASSLAVHDWVSCLGFFFRVRILGIIVLASFLFLGGDNRGVEMGVHRRI